jgi:hypothetical protein
VLLYASRRPGLFCGAFVDIVSTHLSLCQEQELALIGKSREVVLHDNRTTPPRILAIDNCPVTQSGRRFHPDRDRRHRDA